MNSKACLLVFGFLLVFVILACAGEENNDNSLSAESEAARVVRDADGKRGRKQKKRRKNRKASGRKKKENEEVKKQKEQEQAKKGIKEGDKIRKI